MHILVPLGYMAMCALKDVDEAGTGWRACGWMRWKTKQEGELWPDLESSKPGNKYKPWAETPVDTPGNRTSPIHSGEQERKVSGFPSLGPGHCPLCFHDHSCLLLLFCMRWSWETNGMVWVIVLPLRAEYSIWAPRPGMTAARLLKQRPGPSQKETWSALKPEVHETKDCVGWTTEASRHCAGGLVCL